VGDLIRNYQGVTVTIISEIGWNSFATGNTEYLRRFYQTIAGLPVPKVERVYWFCYSDGMVSPFGLVDANGQPKPAYQTYKAIATAPPPGPKPGLMILTATVNKSDYDTMVRDFAQKPEIEADLEVDGVLFKKGEIGFRGTTSLNFPKKGFKIKFPKKQLYQGNTRRIDLSGSYVDKSLIRERLSFDLFGKTKGVASKAWHVDFTIRQ
jgi:hypothetical protein